MLKQRLAVRAHAYKTLIGEMSNVNVKVQQAIDSVTSRDTFYLQWNKGINTRCEDLGESVFKNG